MQEGCLKNTSYLSVCCHDIYGNAGFQDAFAGKLLITIHSSWKFHFQGDHLELAAETTLFTLESVSAVPSRKEQKLSGDMNIEQRY